MLYLAEPGHTLNKQLLNGSLPDLSNLSIIKVDEIWIHWPSCMSSLITSRVKGHHSWCSVTEKSGVKSKIKPPPPSAAVEVTASNFDDVVLNKDKDVLVAFTAPWVSLSSVNPGSC
jgi:protein disulfide-isomerase A6